MLRSSDLIRLPYPPDLTQAGIAIASRRLASGYIRGESRDIHHLHTEVAQASVELAFRRYLLDRHTPFQYLGKNPFTDPEQVTLVLGGRRCEIETSLITDKRSARLLSARPERILEFDIHIPARLQPSDLYHASDLAVFTFANAGVSSDRSELLGHAQAGEPIVCVHVMPEAWRRPERRKAPGAVSFLYAGDTGLFIDLYGLGLRQEHCFEQMALQPHTWTESKYQYLSLSCLQAGAVPAASVEIKSPVHRNAYTVMPLQWRDLWLSGQEIIIAGYMPFDEIWSYWRSAPSGQPRPALEVQVPVSNLHSLPSFLERVSAVQHEGDD